MTPLNILIVVPAVSLQDRQSRFLEFIREENRSLRRHLGKIRLRVTDDARLRLAAKDVILVRKLIEQFATLVSEAVVQTPWVSLGAADFFTTEVWTARGVAAL